MPDVAIKVENLAKLYQIGAQKNGSLRETLAGGFRKIVSSGKAKPNNDFWALNDVSFEIKLGEAVGIIGKNGAGKSTLLKILSRITEPTKGRIEINGRVSSLLEVGTGFHPELTGRENVFLNGTIMGMTRREIKAKFDEIVDFSGVEKFIDTPVKFYSSGMYVRLAFAVAAHLEPEILIIDEVLAVGDAEFQKKCLGKMGEVAGQGRTVIFVSHQMAAISRLCQKAIYLESGRIAHADEASKVIEIYLSEQSRIKSVSKGLGGISVQKIIFRDDSGRKSTTFSSFDQLSVEMQCIAHDSMGNVSFAVCFDNLQDERITSLWSSFIAKEFDVQTGSFSVRFNVPSLKLTPGEYSVVTFIGMGNVEIESVHNIEHISVSYTHKFGHTVEPTSVQGLYIEDFDVEINRVEMVTV